MSKSRLSEYLNSFSKKDWRSFKKYSENKIYQGTDLHRLLTYILKHKRRISMSALSIDDIQIKLFPKKSRKSLLNLFSDLTDIVKDYIIHDQLQSEPYFEQIFLIRGLNKRKLYSQADKIMDKSLIDLSKSQLDWWTPLYRQLILHSHYFSDNPSSSKARSSENLRQILRNLKLYEDEMNALYFFDKENNLKLNRKAYSEIDLNYRFDRKTDSKLIPLIHQFLFYTIDE